MNTVLHRITSMGQVSLEEKIFVGTVCVQKSNDGSARSQDPCGKTEKHLNIGFSKRLDRTVCVAVGVYEG